MVCLPAAFGFSALYLNSFTSKTLCTQMRIVYFGSKLFYAYSSTQKPCEIFCWCKNIIEALYYKLMKTDFHCDKSGLSETFQVIACSCGCFPLDVEHKEDEGGDSAKNEVKLSSCCAPVCDDTCVCTFVCFRLWKFNISINFSRSSKNLPWKMTMNLFFKPLDYERNGTLMVKYQIHLVLCFKTRVPAL